MHEKLVDRLGATVIVPSNPQLYIVRVTRHPRFSGHSSLSRDFSQKVGGLRNRTGLPSSNLQINHTAVDSLEHMRDQLVGIGKAGQVN